MLMPRMRSIICRNERSPICDNAIEWHSDRVTFHTQTHHAIVTQAEPSRAHCAFRLGLVTWHCNVSLMVRAEYCS